MALKNDYNFIDERQLGVSGLNTIVDPSDIDVKFSPDIQNMVFDSGLLSPRKGTRLYAAKPTGETQDPLQTMVFSNSIGEQFLIAVYGNNFYLRDETNERWILLNHSFTPTYTTLIYGFTNWNNGLGDDSGYFCNGRDDFMKWPAVLQELATDATSTDTTVTVDDGVKFPTSGTLVFYDGTTTTTKAYSSKAGNVITLTGALGVSIGSGASVTCEIAQKSGMEAGKYMTTYNRRLVVANEYQNEIKIAYSKVNLPENFTTGVLPADGGLLLITDGNGGITALGDFGEYILITKENNFIRFEIKLTQDQSEKYEIITPLISGKGMGPRTDGASIKIFNSVYYVTPSKDIYSITPTQTGNTSSSGLQNVSSPIYNYMKTLYLDASRVTYNDQKIFFLAGSGEVNNLVLVYDMIRNAWTKFLGWNAADIFAKSNIIYYLDRTNGKIYTGLTNYDDDGSDYSAYFFTKRFNWGKMSMPKTADSVYVEGYITSSTNLYATVLYNERGLLQSKTYKISGTGIYVTQINIGALSQYPMAVVPLGLSESGDIGIFRCYLSIPNKWGFYNMQIKFFTEKAGSVWAVTGEAINPIPEQNVPAILRLDSIDESSEDETVSDYLTTESSSVLLTESSILITL